MEDRIMTESLILGAIYKDLTLATETNLTANDFDNSRTSFYYQLAVELVKNIKSLDELSVMSYVSSSGLKDLYLEYGGYESIKNLQKLGSVKDFNTYVDNLKKYILVKNLKEKRNFDINEPILYKGKKVIPAEALPLMTSYEFHNMIQLFFNDLEVELNDKNLIFEDLAFTEQELKDKLEGKKIDTSEFDVMLQWEEDGKIRFLQNFKILNEILGGLVRKNGVHLLGASSGTGKTTMALNIALGLVNTSNANVLIISNEVQSNYYKNLLSSIVCQNIFHCFSLTRKKISRNEFANQEEIDVFVKANKFIKEQFGNKLRFLSVPTFNKDNVCAIIKREKLKNNMNYIILDTFKYENGAGSSGNIATELVDTSRLIDAVATEFDVGVLLPVQLLVSSDKTSFLTSANLTFAKQIKEIANSVMLMRRVRNFELNPEDSKYFLKPYMWAKGMNGYIKKELKIINTVRNEADKNKKFNKDVLDASKQYVLMRIDKNRNGRSDDLILFEIDELSGVMKEKAYCDHIYMGQLYD